ncbi:MAG TPA: hypothetical protein VHV83_22315 [Armatimonadota bacterium]|nr:hypothetical protein [Armatimonadota bacterium]
MGKFLYVCTIIFLMSVVAQAYPTLAGPTGGAVLPTSQIIPSRQFDIAADYQDVEGDSAFPIRLLYGLGNHLELGAVASFGDDTVWGANAKYRFTAFGVPWAIGALYNNANDLDDQTFQAYLAYTQDVLGNRPDAKSRLYGTAGINWTTINFDTNDLDTTDGNIDAFRFYLGLEYRMLCSGWRFGAEYQFGNNDMDENGLGSAYVRYAFNQRLAAQVGFSNADVTGVRGLDDFNVFAGLRYSFGGPGEETCPAVKEGPGQTAQTEQTPTRQHR